MRKKKEEINKGIILNSGKLKIKKMAIGKNAMIIERKNIKNIMNDGRKSNSNIVNIENSQIGAVGNNNAVADNTFNQQINSSYESVDFAELKRELQELRKNLLSKAETTEHFIAIGEIANAEKASEENDGNKVVKHLKAAGNWVLDAARDIGTNVITDLVKKQTGL